MVTVSPYSIGKLVLAFLMLFAEISKSNLPVALRSVISVARSPTSAAATGIETQLKIEMQANNKQRYLFSPISFTPLLSLKIQIKIRLIRKGAVFPLNGMQIQAIFLLPTSIPKEEAYQQDQNDGTNHQPPDPPLFFFLCLRLWPTLCNRGRRSRQFAFTFVEQIVQRYMVEFAKSLEIVRGWSRLSGIT